MSIVYLPDPHPGRCENFRRDKGDAYGSKYKRCLRMEGHSDACRFDPDTAVVTVASGAASWHQSTPKPWVEPASAPLGLSESTNTTKEP